MAKQRTRDQPRMSLNALTDYMTASALRRRRLVSEQKRPRDFQVAYYREAAEAIAAFLVGDRKALGEGLSQVQPAAGLKEWELGRRLAATEAIRSFQQIGELDLSGFQVRRGPQSPRPLQSGFLSISVRPEILLRKTHGDATKTGALKLFFSKSERLGEDRARFGGVVLYRYLQETSGRAETADYRSRFVVDVFAGLTYQAPRTHKRRWQEIEAACQEIAHIWPTV